MICRALPRPDLCVSMALPGAGDLVGQICAVVCAVEQRLGKLRRWRSATKGTTSRFEGKLWTTDNAVLFGKRPVSGTLA